MKPPIHTRLSTWKNRDENTGRETTASGKVYFFDELFQSPGV
jgi:hypothetical protein